MSGLEDEFNQNGFKICDILGCRKHINLISIHNGMFCLRHSMMIKYIRRSITPHNNTDIEAKARIIEIAVRKNPDEGHINYAINLTKCFNDQIICKSNIRLIDGVYRCDVSKCNIIADISVGENQKLLCKKHSKKIRYILEKVKVITNLCDVVDIDQVVPIILEMR